MRTITRRVLPGFGLTLGLSVTYLSLLVLIPLTACVVKSLDLTLEEFMRAAWSPRARAAYWLTFECALIAALINIVLGLVVSWTLVRYKFPFKTLIDALVDVPLALPTAVTGLVYASLYVKGGWLGQFLTPLGIEVAYTKLGIVLVLIFTGFPFVVRSVQPVLAELDSEEEEAAAVMGSSRWHTFRHVIFPHLLPPLLSGFTLAFARGVGEYGSVVFISSNMPFKTEIAAVLIVSRLEEFAYREAAAVAVVMLGFSFVLLVLISLAERWSQPHAK
ncbi:MAG: sulfate ABC transporter permease subunit CysT [Planctomycetota bacterium]|nr:MAG: sulfate ABC transporter permease subunit CysT [Planctomycetota bacterium]